MTRRKPASAQVLPVRVVHVLAARPELRAVFAVADEIDMWVRWSA
jgi:hypothetical protein